MGKLVTFAILLASTLIGCSVSMVPDALVAGVCSPLSGMLCKVPAILTECTKCRQYFTDTYTVMRT